MRNGRTFQLVGLWEGGFNNLGNDRFSKLVLSSFSIIINLILEEGDLWLILVYEPNDYTLRKDV